MNTMMTQKEIEQMMNQKSVGNYNECEICLIEYKIKQMNADRYGMWMNEERF